MPNLAPNQTVNLGPYRYGAQITFTAPHSDSVNGCPSLDGTHITLKTVPKKLTLTSGTVHVLTAGSMTVSYAITTSKKKVEQKSI
ncbi:MAG: hypothetical protein H7069_12835 [Phormidesmis sp. FL-bin-119]|nr:hypothetical protein [Pedobacter sp.]